MKHLKRFIKDIPFAILLMNGIMVFAAMVLDGDWIYELMPQISGHGLLIMVYALFFARVYRFCIYTWICLLALAAFNLLNIIYFFVDFEYYRLYVSLLIYPILFMYVIYRIRKRNESCETPI